MKKIGKRPAMGVLTQRAKDKANDRQWMPLRDLLMQASEALLSVSSEVVGELAGNYVKFSPALTGPTYAAIWPKVSAPRCLVVGLALPDDFECEGLGPAPERIHYPGLTKFAFIEEGESIPQELSGWAKRAYGCILSSEK